MPALSQENGNVNLDSTTRSMMLHGSEAMEIVARAWLGARQGNHSFASGKI